MSATDIPVIKQTDSGQKYIQLKDGKPDEALGIYSNIITDLDGQKWILVYNNLKHKGPISKASKLTLYLIKVDPNIPFDKSKNVDIIGVGGYGCTVFPRLKTVDDKYMTINDNGDYVQQTSKSPVGLMEDRFKRGENIISKIVVEQNLNDELNGYKLLKKHKVNPNSYIGVVSFGELDKTDELNKAIIENCQYFKFRMTSTSRLFIINQKWGGNTVQKSIDNSIKNLEVRQYFEQLAGLMNLFIDLKHMHQNEIFHLDIKLNNIVSTDGELPQRTTGFKPYKFRFIDFGLAMSLDDLVHKKNSRRLLSLYQLYPPYQFLFANITDVYKLYNKLIKQKTELKTYEPETLDKNPYTFDGYFGDKDYFKKKMKILKLYSQEFTKLPKEEEEKAKKELEEYKTKSQKNPRDTKYNMNQLETNLLRQKEIILYFFGSKGIIVNRYIDNFSGLFNLSLFKKKKSETIKDWFGTIYDDNKLNDYTKRTQFPKLYHLMEFDYIPKYLALKSQVNKAQLIKMYGILDLWSLAGTIMSFMNPRIKNIQKIREQINQEDVINVSVDNNTRIKKFDEMTDYIFNQFLMDPFKYRSTDIMKIVVRYLLNVFTKVFSIPIERFIPELMKEFDIKETEVLYPYQLKKNNMQRYLKMIEHSEKVLRNWELPGASGASAAAQPAALAGAEAAAAPVTQGKTSATKPVTQRSKNEAGGGGGSAAAPVTQGKTSATKPNEAGGGGGSAAAPATQGKTSATKPNEAGGGGSGSLPASSDPEFNTNELREMSTEYLEQQGYDVKRIKGGKRRRASSRRRSITLKRKNK